MASPLPFRLDAAQRERQLAQFNARAEIGWFGFVGALQEPGSSVIRFARMEQGAMGGGGTVAVNGGVIAAGFDAAFVLAGLGHYDTPVVVTLELSVQYLNLAVAARSPVFRAQVMRSARAFSFVQGILHPADQPDFAFATASGMVAPAS
jgi:acyl-coenzyme A thioesterase PaaI-like protein